MGQTPDQLQMFTIGHSNHPLGTFLWLLRQHGITGFQVVRGGDTRQDSVRLALEHVRTPRVITHNAALPFVTPKEIANVAKESDPCVTTVTPVQQSLCRGGEYATEMVRPDDLKLINTPQSFDTDLFRDSHRRAFADKVALRTDCELMMRYGHAVRFVPGDPCNFKITTQLDVLLAEALIQHQKQATA